MSIVTSQQLTRYVEQFGRTEVTFNKQVISATGLTARGVYLKVQDRQWPCVVFSSSMTAAKVIAGVKTTFFNSLRQGGGKLSLRWCFKVPQETELVTFYVSCHASGFTPYNPENPDVQLITLEYTQRPPDDLIMILGSLLEATTNSQRRREVRVPISPENMKKLGIETREATLSINGNAHRGILRDLSFGGARILLPSVPKNATGSTVTMKIAKGEQAGELFLLGTVRRVEPVGGRRDVSVVAVEYVRDTPMSYKLLINSYISSQRKGSTEETSAAPPARRDQSADFPEEDDGEDQQGGSPPDG